MSREDELAAIRQQVSMLAEQVARLIDIIGVRTRQGRDVTPVEERLAHFETLMWKLHRRHARLKAETAVARTVDPIQPAA